MTIATFAAHFAQVDVVFLVAPNTIDSRALQFCVGTMAISAAEAIVCALKFKEAEVMYFLTVFNRESLRRMARRTGRAIF